jgi:hypothetical protein
MNKYIIFSIFLLFSCAGEVRITKTPSCTVIPIENGIMITCPDGTSQVIKNGQPGLNGSDGLNGSNGNNGNTGSNGSNGTNGTNGLNGINTLMSFDNSTTCLNGGLLVSYGLDLNNNSLLDLTEIQGSANICNGINGLNGSMGPQGPSGTNGHSVLVMSGTTLAGDGLCTNGGSVLTLGTDVNDDNILDGTEQTSVAVICNGVDGSNGVDGAPGLNASPTPFTPVGIVDPCGTRPGIFNEVFLKLSNGTLLASFSDNVNGTNTRFSILTAGNYMTTDGDNCTFTVDSLGNITNENHHY